MDIIYFIFGFFILILGIKRNTKSHYWYVVIVLAAYIEYGVSGKLIHNYAPDSVVATVYGVVGNYGLIFYSLMGFVFFLNKKNINYISEGGFRNTVNMIMAYMVIYSIVALYSYSIAYGSINSRNAVNGHAYFLSALGLLLFLFLYLRSDSVQRVYKVVLLYNFILSLLIFKTRGVLIINFCLFVFSFYWCRVFFSTMLDRNIPYKLLVIMSFFIVYILLFSTEMLSGEYSDSSLSVFSKEGSGKRDIAILEWALYLYGQYVDRFWGVVVPVFSPHSTYTGMLGYIGVVYSAFFIVILSRLFYSLMDRRYPPFMAAIMSGVGVLFSVVFVSPISNFPFMFVLIIMTHIRSSAGLRSLKPYRQG